jgi:formyl-CoA transferase/CoA:oxalate CoA-transferase
VGARDALAAILEPLFATRSVDEWLAVCERVGIPCGPILSVAQALAHPQVQARGMVVPLEHPSAGPIRVTGVPVRLSETPGVVRTPPPRLGEHSRKVLGELCGLDDAVLDELVRDGVLGQPKRPAKG